MKTWQEHSRGAWTDTTEATPCDSRIQLGAIQRIATACETMAKNHDALVRDRDLYRRWYENEKAVVARLQRSNAALRGVITKLRKVAKP